MLFRSHWTMLSRIGLVPRVIREGLGLKAAISCHLGELGASFILAHHVIDEIVMVDNFRDPRIRH